MDATEPAQPALTSDYYVSVFRRRIRIILVCTVVGALLGGLYVVARPRGYVSSASVVIRQVTTDPFDAPDVLRGVSAETEQSVMASTVVAERAAQLLNRDVDPESLLTRLTVENPTDTLVLTARFRAGSPERAREGAQAFATAYLAYREEQYNMLKQRTLESIDAELGGLRDALAIAQAEVANLAQGNPNSPEYFAARDQVERIRTRILDAESRRSSIEGVDTEAGEIIKPARLPSSAAGVSRVITVLAFTVLGAVAGLVLALIRHRTDPYLRSREDFVEHFGKPPIAEIRGEQPERVWGGFVSLARPTSKDADAYRHLRVRLWPRRPAKLQRVLVADVANATSTAPLIANVAVSLARADLRSLLIWADGSEIAIDADKLGLVEHIALLPWSKVDGQANTAIDPTVLINVLEEAGQLVDVVLLAGPPVQSSAQTLELCSTVDGVLVSFDPSKVKRQQLDQALDEIRTVGGDVVGVVVDPVPRKW